MGVSGERFYCDRSTPGFTVFTEFVSTLEFLDLKTNELVAIGRDSEIYNIRNPIILFTLWEGSSNLYEWIYCFFFLILWKFKDIKTLNIAWNPQFNPCLCGDMKDGVVDLDNLMYEQLDEYIDVEEYVLKWIKQIKDGNPGWNIGEIKIRTLIGLWQEISAKEKEARAELAKAKKANA
jgi:hypothetical protein